MYFGKNIKHLRKIKGVNQTKLASYIGITKNSISTYERDEGFPEVSKLLKICEYFDTDPTSILLTDMSKTDDSDTGGAIVLNDCDESARYGNVVAKSKDKALAFCEKLIAQLERELERKDKEVGELKAELEKLKGK